MNLQERISLVNQLIRENPDYTIKDYIDHLEHIESVEDDAESLKVVNMNVKTYPTWREFTETWIKSKNY
jgi:hypothetical protein